MSLTTTRRHLLSLGAALGLGCATIGTAFADTSSYPSKPIKITVPWAPGGATDVITRLLGQHIATELGQPVVVDNKPGAGGNIGTGAFVRERPDGYSLLMATSSTNAINPNLYKTLPFKPVKDFAPVAQVATVPNILVVPKDSPFKSVADIVQAAKNKPGTLSYGSAGNGSSQHLAGSMFIKATGVEVTHIPYRGSGPAAADLIAGHLDFMLDTGSMPHIKSGSLKALAVAAAQRLPGLPDVPTFEELGYKDFEAAAWYGIAAPAGTPAEIVEKLNTAINNALKDDNIKGRLQDFGAVVAGGSVQSFEDFFVSEIDRFAILVKESGATVE
ncbi:tripartite tricarboxylate transporter substrate binding protein [Lampropedia puyangensis]|uniref:Tripartite tricarboxylate transporter substrate binding protein n=1 Tax=Lampropedia puyangensis TaxID=1330072 RepID=A0A4S8EQA4_9BURK|nr:tripartite tricarboxylate transporter substrate binding protein [Lampropedia puyangensis]THT96398.1 tripartite tricarboxylate transporter substrate binding protein [Lampropedia puyangensis]